MNEAQKIGMVEGRISIIANTLLFGIKLWAGLVSHSGALIADALHTLSDSVSSLAVIIAAKVSAKPADKEHPYGHGRSELIATLLIGFLLAVVGINFIIDGIEALRNHQQANFGTIAIVVTIISIIVKEALAQYALRVGKKYGSSSVQADGHHHRSDALSSGVLLIGIFVGQYWWWIDGVLSIIIALFILYTSYEISKDTINSMMGEKPETKLIEEINKIAIELYPANLNLHHWHIHNYVYHRELTFHVYLPGAMLIKDGHDIIDALESAIETRFNMETTIHIDPAEEIVH